MSKRDQKAMEWLFGPKTPSPPSPGTISVGPQPLNCAAADRGVEPTLEEKSAIAKEDMKDAVNSEGSTVKGRYNSPSIVVSSPVSREGQSVFQDAEEWPSLPKPASCTSGNDIRNKIGPENKMVRFEGRLMQTGQEEKDEDEALESQEFLSRFIQDWANKVPTSTAVALTKESLAKFISYEIDPASGDYRPRMNHPLTERDYADYQRSSVAMRRHRDVWTSTIRLNQYNHKLQKEAAKRASANETFILPESYVPLTDKPPVVEVEDCILRPATIEDMKGITEIYNLEVYTGLRAWDTQLVRIQDFINIAQQCHKGQLPFIVAVQHKVDLDDASVWPSKAAYKEYMQHQAHRDGDNREEQDNEGKENAEELLLGFGFLQSLDGGFGTGKHVGDMSCRLSVYVHPDYRRKHIGSAIIDRILVCMARTYPGSMVNHRWESNGQSPYNDAELNRMFRFLPNRIIIEGLFRGGKSDDDFEWFDKMMASFRFHEVGIVDGAYSTRRGIQSECLDKIIWMCLSQRQPEPDSGDQRLDWPGVKSDIARSTSR